MGVAEFLFGKKLKIANGEFEFIELDASLNEVYGHDSVTTEHPVESGSDITDHIRVQPIRLSIDGFITNHKLVPTFINFDFTRSEDCYVLFRDWQKQGARLTVTTGLDEYEDMVLKSFSVTRDKETGNSLPIKLELIEIKTVESQLSTAKAPAIKAAQKKKQLAKQAKKAEKRVSLLQQATDAVKKFVK